MALEHAAGRSPLSVEDLSVELRGFRLDTVSFRVEPGAVTAFLGQNGAGKTTTLRLIMGMLRKDGGRVALGSLDHLREARAFKQRIGFVPEESSFYQRMRIADLIRFAAPFYDDWNEHLCAELMRMFALAPEKRVGELSKGTRMKVALIIALAHEPDVLLLDEPTCGLDPRAQREVLRLLRGLAHEQGRAVLVSTHNLPEVERIGDRVIVIDRGRILADESLPALAQAAGTSWRLEDYYLGLVS
jgi:ABC-2 type transport system ATP-binding protein